ncbi:MAG: M14 family zinc carboxypeptidase [Actinomycetes bacterium]
MSRGRRALAGALFVALAAVTTASVLAAASPPSQRERPTVSDSSSARQASVLWAVIGHSRQRRPVVVAQFGAGERRLLVIGGVHGREFGRVVAIRLAKYLAAHPQAVPPGTRIDVLPCLNPDGAALGRRGNARRVDLNRNLPTSDWRGVLRPGDPASRSSNGGSAPSSEPETQALLHYLRQGFDAVISLHSQGGFIDFNGPHARAIALAMSRACGLPLGRIAYQSSITGSLGEYVPVVYGIPVITVELRRAKLTHGLLAAVTKAAGEAGALAPAARP